MDVSEAEAEPAPPVRSRATAIGAGVAAVYFVASLTWILGTDAATSLLVHDLTTRLLVQTAKESAFILVTSALLFWALRMLVRDVEASRGAYLQAEYELVNRLALAAEFRDDSTGGHNYRIGRYAQILGREIGLTESHAEMLMHAAMLHDIGKIGVLDAILHKPGTLLPHERQEMRRHVEYGARLLDGSRHPLVRLAHSVALNHHENWDGSGYPAGKRGEEIPLEGRIVAVCDVFDALVSDRPYKEAWSSHEAVREIKRLAGVRFDPKVVDAFLNAQDQILAVRDEKVDRVWLRGHEESRLLTI